jgi:hypothetical protein
MARVRTPREGADYIPRPQRSDPTVWDDLIQRSGSGVWGGGPRRALGVIGSCHVPSHRAEVAAQAGPMPVPGWPVARLRACRSGLVSGFLGRSHASPAGLAHLTTILWRCRSAEIVEANQNCTDEKIKLGKRTP